MIAQAWNAIQSNPGVFIFLGFCCWAYVKLVLWALRSADIE